MATKRCEWIWWNGLWKRWEDANVHVSTHALHYGSSVFEGLRAYETAEGPAILGLAPHVKRLFQSCKMFRLGISYTPAEVTAAITSIVARNGHRACYVRPLVFCGAGGFALDPRKNPTEMIIFSWEWGQYLGPEALENGVNVCVSSWRRAAPSTVPVMAKIGGNYIGPQLATMEAVDNGFDEAICLDVNGLVSEGTSENLFVVHNNTIFTAPVGCSLLAGVNRGYVIELARLLGYEVREQALPRELLYIADEMFFTGTAVEITPIRSVDRLPVGQGGPGPVTRRIQENFFGIVQGRLPDTLGWLTPVRSANSSHNGSLPLPVTRSA
jgi:branched-chain amino acid aminotransferase